jgi:sugar lactone lactonase YvrE
MPSSRRLLMSVALALLPTTLAAQAPTFEQIGAYIQGGLEALAKGDTAAYLAGTGKAFAVAPQVPPVAYHHSRAHALGGRTDSAVILLQRLAREGAAVSFDAAEDSAFVRLRTQSAWTGVAAAIAEAKRPISYSTPAFELAERDLTAEGTAWDAKTSTVYVGSLYKRKIVAVGPDGAPRDVIRSGQDDIGPVVGIEVDPVRRGLWVASMVLPEAGIPLTDTTYAAHGLLFHYEVDSGRLRRKYVLPPSGGVRHGFNDLTVMPNGDVYLTDSASGAVHRLRAGADDLVEVVPPSTYLFPNGITRSDDGRYIFVSHGAGIDRIEVASRRRIRLATPDTLNLGGIDGLAFYRNALIAHQPSWFQRVIRLELDSRQERVASWATIERHHPRFDFPTTGEVAGDTYYYIANAQLRRFRDGKIFPWDSLQPVLVLRTDLRKGDASKARDARKGAIRSGAPLGDEVRRAVANAFLTPPAPGPSPRQARADRPES